MLWINQASKAINKSAQHEPKSNKIHKESKRNCQLGQLGVCFPFGFFIAAIWGRGTCRSQYVRISMMIQFGEAITLPPYPAPRHCLPTHPTLGNLGPKLWQNAIPTRARHFVCLSVWLSVCLIINVKCGLIVDAQWAQAVCELPFNRVPCLLPACLLPLPAPAY